MAKRNIGMWLYQNSGGDVIQKKMIKKLKEREIEVSYPPHVPFLFSAFEAVSAFDFYVSQSLVRTNGRFIPVFLCRHEPLVLDFYWKIAHYLPGINDDNVLMPPYIHSLRLFFSSMFNF